MQNQSDQNFACEESSDFEMFEDSFSSVSESDSDYYTQNKKSVEGKYGMLVFSLTIEGDSCPIASFPKWKVETASIMLTFFPSQF